VAAVGVIWCGGRSVEGDLSVICDVVWYGNGIRIYNNDDKIVAGEWTKRRGGERERDRYIDERVSG
jgi:hypothetical protein